MPKPFSLVLVLCALCSIASAQTTQPIAPIIELRGDGASIGAAHGAALGKQIRGLHETYLAKAIDPKIHPTLAQTAMGFEPRLLPEHLAEIKSLAAATKLDEAETMLANSFLDLSPMEACSTISLPADAAPDHVARFARNLDFPSLGVADKASVVLVYHPNDRFGFVTVGWPGMIGALSGMNEVGLTLANMEVTRPAATEVRAMPYTLLYRTLLEQCTTVDQAIDVLKKTPRQTPNNLMLMDADGHRAVVELTPDSIVVRSGKPDAALISTNHQRGQDTDTPGWCTRYDYLHDTAAQRFGQLDRAALQSMLQHVQQEQMTLQSMIFEPGNRVIYLSTGMNAPDGQMREIDLKAYFR
jgi:isopenicillin-N N-acyltransferase like protein